MKKRHAIIAQAAAIACLASIPAAAAISNDQRPSPQHGKCFPAKLWNSGNVPLKFSPCARIDKVYEDGSVKVSVIDRGSPRHHGAIRYSFGYGAEDR